MRRPFFGRIFTSHIMYCKGRAIRKRPCRGRRSFVFFVHGVIHDGCNHRSCTQFFCASEAQRAGRAATEGIASGNSLDGGWVTHEATGFHRFLGSRTTEINMNKSASLFAASAVTFAQFGRAKPIVAPDRPISLNNGEMPTKSRTFRVLDARPKGVIHRGVRTAGDKAEVTLGDDSFAPSPVRAFEAQLSNQSGDALNGMDVVVERFEVKVFGFADSRSLPKMTVGDRASAAKESILPSGINAAADLVSTALINAIIASGNPVFVSAMIEGHVDGRRFAAYIVRESSSTLEKDLEGRVKEAMSDAATSIMRNLKTDRGGRCVGMRAAFG